MEVLKDLIEKRDAAAEAFKADADEFRAIEGAVSDERAAQYAEKRDAVKALDARIAEVRDEMKRESELAEARKDLDKAGAPAVVKSEPRTYGHGSEASYFQDLAATALPGRPEYSAAVARMQAHGQEVVRDCINDSELRAKVQRKAESYFRKDESTARRFRDSLESRAMATPNGTGGEFVTPVYLVDEYAPFRQAGRAFIDQTNKMPLPEYGMTVYIPQVSTAATVQKQTTENTLITDGSPTTAYLSSSLITEAGNVTVSQQLLDRAGPGIQFDKIVFDQLVRNYNKNIDTAVLTSALATSGIGTVANTKTATGYNGAQVVQNLLADTAAAQANMESTDGTILSATHLYATPTQWAFTLSSVGSDGRPLLTPRANGPWNSAAGPVGDTASTPEGMTNYDVLDYPVFKDANIPTTNSGADTQLILAHMPEVFVWEGDLVQRAIPQTFAQNLSVLLQVYTYYTVIVRYPKAIQSISGARYPLAPTFAQV